jgi:hypothetical protein
MGTSMPSREKDQADFDLETFVDLFDTAMSSDNPAVKKALRNLIMISAIVNAEDTKADVRQGPLRRLVEDQKNIIRRLENLENNKGGYYPGYGPTPPTNIPSVPWGPVPLTPITPITAPNTGTWPYPPGQIWASTSFGASSTAYDDQFISESTDKYATLLNKLEAK